MPGVTKGKIDRFLNDLHEFMRQTGQTDQIDHINQPAST